MASFMQVLKKMLIRALYGAYVIVAERKDATATITETVPRQHSSSSNSIEIPMQRRSVRVRAKDGGALPDTGFPHVGGKAKEGQRAPDNSDTEQTRAFHTTYAFGPRVIVSAVIPSRVHYRNGSSS